MTDYLQPDDSINGPGQSDQTVAVDHEHYFDRAIIEAVPSEAWNLTHKE